MKKNLSLILCGLLSAIVLHTCIQIEVWNYLAGGNVLPNREGGKLRYMIGTTEQGWRLYHSNRTHDLTLLSGRPLTAEEQSMYRQHQQHTKRHNNVVSWSRGMGTPQYLLAPIALIWSAVLLLTGNIRRTRVLAGLFSVANALSIVAMLYRGYFND